MTPFLFILASCLGILLLTAGVLIHSFLVVVTVENVSMTPTLEPGDRVLVVRPWPTKWLRKGYIVLVWPWRSSSAEPTLFEVKPYIKRIVGLGGEALTASLTEEAKTDHSHEHHTDSHQSQQTWHIPQGHIFVRGDNQQSSLDSLAWGPIPLYSVLGVVLLKLPRKALSPPPSVSLPETFVPIIGLPAGQDAPPFVAQTLHGETVTHATYSGRAVMYLFISPSNHCRRVIPMYAALAPKAAEAGVTLVFVSSTGIQATRPFVDELRISVSVLVAPRASNPFLRDYNISVTPAYCFVNEQGKIQSAGDPTMRGGEWKTLAESWVRHEISVPNDLP